MKISKIPKYTLLFESDNSFDRFSEFLLISLFGLMHRIFEMRFSIIDRENLEIFSTVRKLFMTLNQSKASSDMNIQPIK